MLSHNSITNYYSLNFSLAQHHNYSIEDLENLIPFEHSVYVNMLIDYLEKKKEIEANG
jgi:hypothetical protein